MTFFKKTSKGQEFFFSIREKFLLLYFPLVVIPLVLIVALAVEQFKISIRQQVMAKLESIGSFKETQINYWMERNKSVMEAIHDSNTLFDVLLDDYLKTKNPDQAVQVRKALENILLYYPQFEELFLVDVETRKVALSTHRQREGRSGELADYLDTSYRRAIVTPVYYSDFLARPTAVIATPILLHETNEFSALLAGRINLKAFDDFLLDRPGLGASGEAYLATGDGTIIGGLGYAQTHWDIAPSAVSSHFSSTGLLRSLAGQSGTDIYNDYRGVPVIGNYRFMPESSLVMLVEQDLAEALLPVQLVVRKIIFVFLVTLALALLVLIFFARLITQPIQHLTSVAQRIARGKFNIQAKIETHDEIGRMASSFNAMAHQIVGSFQELKYIVNALPDGLCITDADGKIILINPFFAKVTHHAESALIGEFLGGFLQLDAAKKHLDLKNILRDARESKKVVTFNAFLSGKKDEYIPVSASVVHLSMDDRRGSAYLFVFKDLRELRRYAESRINELIPYLNRISIGDFSQPVPLPQTDDEFMNLYLAIGLMEDNLRELIRENQFKTTQLANANKKLLATGSHLKQEKAKAEALLENMGEAVVATDIDLNIIMINRVGEKLFGLPIKKIIGHPLESVYDLYNENHLKIASDARPICRALKQGRVIKELVYAKSNGHFIPLYVTASPIFLDKKLIGIVAVYRDVTKERAIDQAKTEFVSLASHQLRTPLTSIKWILQELTRKQAGLNAWQKEYLEDALRSNERMILLVNDLLNVSRLEAGGILIEPTTFSVHDLVKQVVHEATVSAKEKHQKIVVKMPKKSISITSDLQLVRQVVANLVSNAIKYSDNKKTITVTLEAPKRGGVKIVIKDQGIGVPKELQKRLFEKFFRTEEAARRSTTGSGLGLYIVKKIVESLHGKISFESEANVGSAFTIVLPEKISSSSGSKKLIEHQIS